MISIALPRPCLRGSRSEPAMTRKTSKRRKNPHIGSSFESWLQTPEIREDITAAAIKAVIARKRPRSPVWRLDEGTN
jgi:hypothetical protein